MRHGDLSLRTQDLTGNMLEALRIAPCRVELSLVAPDSGAALSKTGLHYAAQSNTFYYLRANIKNTSGGWATNSSLLSPALTSHPSFRTQVEPELYPFYNLSPQQRIV